MNYYFIFFLCVLIGNLVLDTVLDLLNLRSFQTSLPEELRASYDPAQHTKARDYYIENTRFGITARMVSTLALIVFLIYGGYNWTDQIARHFGFGEIGTGLIFITVLLLLKSILQLPFSIYHTFVIEARYGFNRTTPKTFILDIIRGTVVGIIIGAPILALLIHLFDQWGSMAWLYAWAGISAFQLLLAFIAPVWILPIFNKFTPVEPGELREAIAVYAKEQSFTLQGVFVMDGSKRSSKSNAFFTGFGKFRRLVLFDTILSRQSLDEIMAVVAHEAGHFKKKHIPQFMAISLISSGIMFFVLQLFMRNQSLFEAFRMEQVSTYASLVFVSLIYGPVLRYLSIFPNMLSRKFEYEADEFSLRTFGRPRHKVEALASALKKLSVDNLSHPTPHPLKVALDYTHPPVLARIKAMRIDPTS